MALRQPRPYMVKNFKNVMLQNQSTEGLDTWYVVAGNSVLPWFFKCWPRIDPGLFYANLKYGKMLDHFIGSSENFGIKMGIYGCLSENINISEYMRWSLFDLWPEALTFWQFQTRPQKPWANCDQISCTASKNIFSNGPRLITKVAAMPMLSKIFNFFPI